MPQTKKKKPTQPIAPTPPPAPIAPAVQPTTNPDNLPVIYDRLEITEYSTASPKGPLTIADMKGLLGWETEKEFEERKVKEFPNTKPNVWVFGEAFHCKNVAGEKVRCNYNAHNRPFDDGWCESLIHTILYGQWAGPFTVPGETVNGETVRISRYGRVLSGQHQMTACILGGEWIEKHRRDGTDSPAAPKYPVWAKYGLGQCPFLETIVITGMSEDPRVLMTVDYVKPRTAADVFYTSEVFKSSTPPERKELCKMLATAVDTLWTRTDAKGYRTHPELVGFLERHKRLMECVTHLYAENSAKAGRKVSKLRLSAGQCSALMYLMAAGATAPEASDEYRNMEPPSEKGIDLGLWDKAKEFWTLLTGGRDFLPVRTAIGRLTDSTPGSDDNQGLGGRNPEKLAVLAKAWERWKDHPASAGPPFGDDDLADGGLLSLSYSDLDDKGNKLPDGQIKLLDVADFYGIDCPEVIVKGRGGAGGTPMPPPPTREEIERATQEALRRRQQQK